MQYNRLRDEKMVSRFGMGCMRLPKTKGPDGTEIIDEKESIKMIRYAIDNGVNYIDTAHVYPGSEVIVGKALKDGYRQKVMIATKSPVWDVSNYDDYQKFFDEELQRLQTDYVDVYLLHSLNKAHWEKVKKADGVRFMQRLKEKGKAKKIGFSFHDDFTLFEEIIGAGRWDICMIQLNIMDQNEQAGVRGLKYAAQQGLDVVIMEPLKGGTLAENVPEEVDALLSRYGDKRSLVEWAFRWLYNHEEVKVILSGVSNMKQLKENIEIFKHAKPNVMTRQDFELIDKVITYYNGRIKVNCTGCGYCMPCPQGIDIPHIFWSYNQAYRYSAKKPVSGKDASDCIACKKCESHCPQNIDITAKLKEAQIYINE